jgi:hypothetical protein
VSTSLTRNRPSHRNARPVRPAPRLRPNTRLKLAAPLAKESGGRPESRCSRIPFVNTSAWRRSLSAIR